MPKKMKKDGDPSIHRDLKGFDIRINKLGEMETNFNIDKVNEFLNKNVVDKKLESRKGEEE